MLAIDIVINKLIHRSQIGIIRETYTQKKIN